MNSNDFAHNVHIGKSFASSGYWKIDADSNSHGTVLAEIIASFFSGPMNTKQMARIYPRLLIGQIVNSQNKTSTSLICQGLTWAVQNGAKIILLCALSTRFDREVERAILKATRKGVIIVVPSSYSASDASLRFPATMGVVIRA
ncbi:S8 family serine peptidase, partial [Patescibacteria group bacterium]|nr:S8 family serine peptidase [Patescibacteria group bacterium]